MSREAERGLKHLDTRIAETDARILEVENELARRSGDLQALQDRLDRELDGLQ
jgi:ATP/maltotriose-dependent transcriptional regulator MalT